MSFAGKPNYGALPEPDDSPHALSDLGGFVPGHHIIGEDHERWLEGYHDTSPEHSLNIRWPTYFPSPYSVFNDQETLHDSEVFGNRSIGGDLQYKLVQKQQATEPLRSLDDLPNPNLPLTPSVSDPSNEQVQSSATTTPLPARKVTVRRRYGPGKWEAIRDVLHEIYILQGNTLPQTMKILREKHGFIASDKQYKNKIRAWGFQKNKKRSQTEKAPAP